MKILITGAGGFLGSYVATELVRDGHEVHTLSRPGAKTIQGTLAHFANFFETPELIEVLKKVQPEVLIHAAWYVEHGKYLNSPENKNWARQSYSFFQSFYEMGGSHIIGIGTCFEYDWSCSEMDETLTPLRPGSFYAQAKHELHLHLEGLSKKLGKKATWARIFFPYGPGEVSTRLIPLILNRLKDNQELPALFTKRKRDFIHAEDIGRAISHIIKKDLTGPINIASAQATSLEEIAREALKVTGKTQSIHNSINEDTEPTLIVAKPGALALTGWTPKITLHEGLKNYWSVMTSLGK
jgi:nucleoside-diphosphate-sugar epimerase